MSSIKEKIKLLNQRFVRYSCICGFDANKNLVTIPFKPLWWQKNNGISFFVAEVGFGKDIFVFATPGDELSPVDAETDVSPEFKVIQLAEEQDDRIVFFFEDDCLYNEHTGKKALLFSRGNYSIVVIVEHDYNNQLFASVMFVPSGSYRKLNSTTYLFFLGDGVQMEYSVV